MWKLWKKKCEQYFTAFQLKKLYLILNRFILIQKVWFFIHPDKVVKIILNPSKISSLFTVYPTVPENIVQH